MSAKFNKDDAIIYIPERLDQFSQTILESQFDFQTDHDIMNIELQIKENKVLKRICLVKSLLFPFEYLLLRLLVGKNHADDAVEFQSVYWDYFRGRIDTETLSNKLLKKV